jgi:hypothetical protein
LHSDAYFGIDGLSGQVHVSFGISISFVTQIFHIVLESGVTSHYEIDLSIIRIFDEENILR